MMTPLLSIRKNWVSTCLEDTVLSETKRWVLVAAPGAQECSLLLAKAAEPAQEYSVGNQTGGRVFLFLYTDDFQRDFLAGVQIRIPSSIFVTGFDLHFILWILIFLFSLSGFFGMMRKLNRGSADMPTFAANP
jgi:hypothetical protein